MEARDQEFEELESLDTSDRDNRARAKKMMND
jgi:hypothetical protein